MTKTSSAKRSRKGLRLLAGALAATAGLALLPSVAPVGAQTAVPPPRSTAAFCEEVPATNPFPDVDDSNTFAAQIRCLAAAEITQGQANGNYGPRIEVSRDQMATFIARMIDKAKELDVDGTLKALPAYDGNNRFSDVADDSVHTPAINRLAAAGIVAGGPGGRPASEFGPSLDVTRAQMASFINRAIQHLTGDKLTTTVDDYFSDLDNVSAEQRADINGIASEGIATGPGDGTYRPRGTVRREAMSAFLVRPLAYLHAEGEIRRLDAFPEASDGPINGTGAATQGDTNKGAEVRTTAKGTSSFTACPITALDPHIDTVDEARCRTYRYATGDTFSVDGTSASLDAFVAQLSPYDDVTGTYARDGASTFSLRNEAPLAPGAVTLEGTGSNRVTVTIAPSATPGIDAYEVQRSAPSAVGSSCSVGVTFTKVGEQPAAGDGNTIFVDSTVQPQTAYCYRVFAIDDGDPSTASVTAGPVTTPAASVAGAPKSVAIELRQPTAPEQASSPNKIDAGDTILIAFNEAMAAPNSGDAILVKDSDTNAQISCTSTNCSRNSAPQAVRGTMYPTNQVITIALMTNPSRIGGEDTGLNVDADIYDERGFTDVESNRWDIDGSPALTISTFAAPRPASTSVTVTNGAGFASQLDAGDVVRLEFDKEMAAPTNGDSFSFPPAFGETSSTNPNRSVRCGLEATCALTSDTRVIEVTITSSTLQVALPAAIVAQGGANSNDKGYTSAANAPWDLCASPDLTVNTTKDTGDAGKVGC